MERPTDFDLEQWEKEAKRLVMCTGCYGVGQRQAWGQDNWLLCERCKGSGKAEAEMHTLQLIAEVRRLKDQHAKTWERAADVTRQEIANVLRPMYDYGVANLAFCHPIPPYTEE